MMRNHHRLPDIIFRLLLLALLQVLVANNIRFYFFVGGQKVLKDVELFEKLRFPPSRNTTTTTNVITRINNVDLLETDSQREPIPICHLVILFPFTKVDFSSGGTSGGGGGGGDDGPSPRTRRTSRAEIAFAGLAGALLAVQHLNTGNGTIVRELDGLNDRCTVRFTTEVLDTGRNQQEAVRNVMELVNRNPTQEEQRAAALPCAVVGAVHSSISIPTSIITGLYGYPQISPISTTALLDDANQFPLFGRSIPSDKDTTIPAIRFLRYQLGVKHLAVIHNNDAYGNAYAAGLQMAAGDYATDMTVLTFDFPFELTTASLELAVSNLKQTGFRYFFGVIPGFMQYEPVMKEAYKQKIAGTGKHCWIFSDTVPPSYFDRTFERGSALHLASVGALRISAFAGISGMDPTYDKFLRAIRELNNPRDIAYIDGKHPTYPQEPDFVPVRISDDPVTLFSRVKDIMMPFAYDATVALGLAACAAASKGGGPAGAYFDGKTHFDAFKNTSFVGATGRKAYNPDTGTRLSSSTRFLIWNFYPDEDKSTETTVSFRSAHTNIYSDGKWTQRTQIVFNDNSTVPPPDLPPVNMNFNYIGPGLRAVSLLLSALILVCSVAFALWTHVRRNSRVIRASQPFFLYMISAGVFLMGSSIIFLSLDDDVVASPNALNATCSLTIWFFSMGWVVSFSALFTKTNRINQIIHNPRFKRITVTVWDALKPMLALMAVSVLILTLWSVLHPPVWRRRPVDFDSFSRTIESIGYCTYNETGAPYLIPLAVIFIGVLAYSVYEAYVARKLSTEFAESEFIAMILAATLLVFFMGIPVLFMSGDDKRAFLFVATAIIFVVCMAMLLLIFVPKIIYQRNYDGKKHEHVHITGLHLESGEADATSLGESDGFGILVLQHPKEVERLIKEDHQRRLTVPVQRANINSAVDAGSVVDGRKSDTSYVGPKRNAVHPCATSPGASVHDEICSNTERNDQPDSVEQPLHPADANGMTTQRYPEPAADERQQEASPTDVNDCPAAVATSSTCASHGSLYLAVSRWAPREST